jgi:hypothetical protein
MDAVAATKNGAVVKDIFYRLSMHSSQKTLRNATAITCVIGMCDSSHIFVEWRICSRSIFHTQNDSSQAFPKCISSTYIHITDQEKTDF